MRTFVYIDGFNFYYNAVKNTPYKWLDFKALSVALLKPYNVIEKIKYFTALVSNNPRDPDKLNRQKIYIKALEKYIPELEVFYGHFLSHPVRAPLANPSPPKYFEQVIKTEEKGFNACPGVSYA